MTPLLALDIGTRKVAGLVVEATANGMRVLAGRVREHADRAMLDGQVHKIEAVAQVVLQVKQELEQATGLTFTEAAVAAAGRALLTRSASRTRRFPYPQEIGPEDVRNLELAAAREALTALRAETRDHALHCVGFSAVRFLADDQPLDDLIGHQAKTITAEVIATFLPRQVVESLMAVLRRAGLTAHSLTLEPIAALEATIPLDLRRMNLALVDVGAGTSDIALTRDGSVFAYAMVTEAGDEITERLCDQYLMEFPEAERVKRSLDAPGDPLIAFRTLLGQTREARASELRTALRPAVDQLARDIAQAMTQLNQGAPRAVVLVGGGSATPQLGPTLAATLGLEPHRVGARGPNLIPGLENTVPAFQGIAAVTPLGIALSALRGRSLAFVNLTVNDQTAQVLSLHGEPTVFDALLAMGREVQRLYPRPGLALSYTLEGKVMTLPGTLGELARIVVNGSAAQLDTRVQAQDRIQVNEAQDGVDALLTPERLTAPKPRWCVVNDQPLELELVLAQHGEPVPAGTRLADRAELEWVSAQTLAELVPECGSVSNGGTAYKVRVNGQVREVSGPGRRLNANGRPVGPAYRPRSDDRIEWQPAAQAAVCLRDLVTVQPGGRTITVEVNGQTRTLDAGGSRVRVNGRLADSLDETVPDQAEVVVEAASNGPILSQVLEGLPLTPPDPPSVLKLRVNGQEAGFTTPLTDGARVEVYFE